MSRTVAEKLDIPTLKALLVRLEPIWMVGRAMQGQKILTVINDMIREEELQEKLPIFTCTKGSSFQRGGDVQHSLKKGNRP